MWRSVTDGLARGSLRPALTLGLLVAVVFGPAVGFDFVRWDDPVNVTHNPLLTEPWSVDLLARLVNGDTALRFKPLPWLLYRGLYAGFGFNPMAWHTASLVLHLAAALVLRLVLRDLLARLYPTTAVATRDWLAWCGAALWAVHPAHVEPACWVTATPYPLMVFFLAGSFRFYLRAMDPAQPAQARANLWRAWWLALAAYATYPVAATYGLWLMAADVWIFRTAPENWRERREMGRWLARHAAFLLPAVIGVMITLKSSSATPWLYLAPPTLAEVDLAVRLKMNAALLSSVWTNLLWPFGQTPNNAILPSWRIDGALIPVMASLAVLALAAVWFLRRRCPRLAGVLFGSTLLALPVLGFGQWPHWAVADRHAYLAHMILTGGLVAGLAALPFFSGPKARGTPWLMIALAGLALLGRNQVMIWRDTDTLFRYVEAQPAFSWNPAQQGYIYQLWAAHAEEQGRTNEARTRNGQARRALQEGSLLAAEHGAFGEAVEISRLLEQSFGLPPQLRRERARWLLGLGRFTEAGHDLRRTAAEMPDDQETRTLVEEWLRGKQPVAGNHL
ncbi:MAG TPA: hypothetical protein VHN79_04770 [Lacunisphaera sp.]|nr:hypothetical protein [Lacunisphaera sp.]